MLTTLKHLKQVKFSNFKFINTMERRAAGFIVFRRVDDSFQYLLLQASYGSEHWTPPKGHVNPGESDIETAYRETKEEAGFGKDDLCVVNDFQRELRYNVNGRPKVVVYWLAQLISDIPVTLSSEHQNYVWGTLNTACELASYKDLQDVLHECEEYLKQNSL